MSTLFTGLDIMFQYIIMYYDINYYNACTRYGPRIMYTDTYNN